MGMTKGKIPRYMVFLSPEPEKKILGVTANVVIGKNKKERLLTLHDYVFVQIWNDHGFETEIKVFNPGVKKDDSQAGGSEASGPSNRGLADNEGGTIHPTGGGEKD